MSDFTDHGPLEIPVHTWVPGTHRVSSTAYQLFFAALPAGRAIWSRTYQCGKWVPTSIWHRDAPSIRKNREDWESWTWASGSGTVFRTGQAPAGHLISFGLDTEHISPEPCGLRLYMRAILRKET